MDAHGIYVFHAADCQCVANVVADHFNLYLVPAFQITLYQRPADR